MGEVLSQSEIDSLLKALSTGELDAEQIAQQEEKQVKNYDFARPSKFSKENLRTLEFIYEHYARLPTALRWLTLARRSPRVRLTWFRRTRK